MTREYVENVQQAGYAACGAALGKEKNFNNPKFPGSFEALMNGLYAKTIELDRTYNSHKSRG
jgi:hypothetical protein